MVNKTHPEWEQQKQSMRLHTADVGNANGGGVLSTLVVLVFLVGLFTVVAFVIKHVAIAAALVLIAFIFFAVRISVSE